MEWDKNWVSTDIFKLIKPPFQQKDLAGEFIDINTSPNNWGGVSTWDWKGVTIIQLQLFTFNT